MVVVDGGIAGGVVGIGVVVLVVLVVATSRKAVLSTSFSYQLYYPQTATTTLATEITLPSSSNARIEQDTS